MVLFYNFASLICDLVEDSLFSLIHPHMQLEHKKYFNSLQELWMLFELR